MTKESLIKLKRISKPEIIGLDQNLPKIDQKIISLEQGFAESTITPVIDPLLEQYNIELWVKRDDLIHPIISGNKWRKLKYIVNHALSQRASRLVSMGGAYSNHLHALAYVGKQLALSTTGIIRGERPAQGNPTLTDLENWGMQLQFVSRQSFRDLRGYKHFDDIPGQQHYGYWIAEGGATAMAMQGLAELITEIDRSFDIVCVPCGTGTTLAGLLLALDNVDRAIGFSALKGGVFLERDIKTILQRYNYVPEPAWEINLDYHFGGFARSNKELEIFIDYFNQNTAITLDPVYTGKMFYGIFDLIKKGEIKPGQRVLALHTGGLQGARTAI